MKKHKWYTSQKVLTIQEEIPGETGDQTTGEVPEQWEKAHVLSLINMRVVLDRQGPFSMSFHTHKAYQDKVDHFCVPQDVRTRTRFGGFQLR